MILGDPFEFAVIAQKVKDWNINDTHCYGTLLFCIDGEIFPKKINNTNIKFELSAPEETLKNLVVNDELYNMPKYEAFCKICDLVYPEEIDNDYRFRLSPEIFIDVNCEVFIVSNGNHVRIMAASDLIYNKEESRYELKDISISEIYITLDEFKKILSQFSNADIYKD